MAHCTYALALATYDIALATIACIWACEYAPVFRLLNSYVRMFWGRDNTPNQTLLK